MTPSITDSAVKAAIAAIESDSATVPEKIEMLIEIAAGLQNKPKSIKPLEDAVSLYRRALELCPPEEPLLRARVLAGMGTALRTIPATGCEQLLEAKEAYMTAMPLLQEYASPEENAEFEMNLGLVLQALTPFGEATLIEAVQLYQRALRVFSGQTYPQEYAILQNNLAIAYLSLPLAAEREEMRQGLAVQAFEDALKWVTLIDHPSEYAMLQNNLANALQYLPSAHPVENNLKALNAYDEALKVRTAQDTPIEYANTIANKANVLFNLPDDLEQPEKGNLNNLKKAKAYYEEARKIFIEHQEWERAKVAAQALQDIEQELLITNSQ
ncbi:hypothetical protein [Gloeothece verrucosa]|uniref:TPR repeat-containing protein n=1 Tax=Gloeothece verrucosa (strain PCC 7822) TaxID=497965 RepID=E0U7G1_GLOV7|nr:hypothetical protein [Gloeothece verrucosa]ADN13657.1 conserved hypothetical protein [Gloeothece verrucosa PCC 7822]